jgi:hypothetical protein
MGRWNLPDPIDLGAECPGEQNGTFPEPYQDSLGTNRCPVSDKVCLEVIRMDWEIQKLYESVQKDILQEAMKNPDCSLQRIAVEIFKTGFLFGADFWKQEKQSMS